MCSEEFLYSQDKTEDLITEAAHWERDLEYWTRQVELHLILAHIDGIPATTCHDCMQMQHAIISDRIAVSEIQQELKRRGSADSL